jgi:hypothetical protein
VSIAETLDLAPPMRAVDLSAVNLPGWVRVRAAHRLNADGLGQWPWQTFARIAVSHAELPHVANLVFRVLIDWHRNKAKSATAQLRDVGAEASLSRQTTSHAVTSLAAWGWVHVSPAAGKGSTLTLLVPVDDPPDRRSETVRPVAHRDTPPVAHRDTPVAHRDTPVAHRDSIRGTGVQGYRQGSRKAVRDAIPRAPRSPEQIEIGYAP